MAEESNAVRLIFEVTGDEIRLVEQQRVDVAIAGFDLPQERLPGDYVEVRSSDARVLSRVPVRSGLDTSVEVFPEDPTQPITRTNMPDLTRAFTVVVPAPAHADHVAVVRSAPARIDPDAVGVVPSAELTSAVVATFKLEPDTE
jgi:hypothetical protein